MSELLQRDTNWYFSVHKVSYVCFQEKSLISKTFSYANCIIISEIKILQVCECIITEMYKNRHGKVWILKNNSVTQFNHTKLEHILFSLKAVLHLKIIVIAILTYW